MIALNLPGVRAVGFDLDGTLLDHPAAASAGAVAFARHAGVTPTSEIIDLWFTVEKRHFQRWLDGEIDWQVQRRERVRDMYAAMGVAVADDAAADAAFDAFRDAYVDAWAPYGDVVETLERLRAAGVTVAVLTNGPGEQQRDKLDRIGISHLVDHVCAADEIDAVKPQPAAFAALLAATGTTPADTLFIGDDLEADIAGAEAAGLRSAIVRSRLRGIAELPSALRRAASRPAFASAPAWN